ncbi:MAG: discoidin domain-containing protein [Verrucomicrobiota bacterium]
MTPPIWLSVKRIEQLHHVSGRVMRPGKALVAIMFLALLFCLARVFAATPPGTASLSLAWNPNPETDIASYQLSYGTSTGSHPSALNAGAATTATATGLMEGTTYYFVVTATNLAGLQSQPSAEIFYQIPVTQAGSVTVIPRSGWSLRYVDSQAKSYAATNAFDGNPNTFWATDYLNAATQPPHEIQIDLGAVYPVGGFRYLPRQDAYSDGNVDQYEFYVSMDGSQWGTAVAAGHFANTKAEQEVLFSSVNGRYVRLRILSDFNADPNCAVAELNVLQGAAVVTPLNHAPVFTLNPILGATASEGIAYTGQSLTGQATDVDAGDTLTYSKVSGPAWLTVATNGDLSGTPPTGSAGLNSFGVRATDHASATADTELRITVTGLPLPWVTTEVGTGQLAGSTVYATGTFTQAGSGKFGGTSDNFRFTYQTLSGDGEISAQVSALQNPGTASRVGVMIRDSLAANAMQVFMGMTGSNSYVWARRTATGGNNSTNNSNTGTVPNTWVRLVRSGNTLTAYKSSNGTSWTSAGKTTVTMAANCYIGLAVASGSNTSLNTSRLSNIHITP